MKNVSPELPADATTIMPVADALSLATASASYDSPNGDPSDILITSRRSLTSSSPFGSVAQSIASTTTEVLPPQPNTRSAYSSALGATPGPMRNVPGSVDGL